MLQTSSRNNLQIIGDNGQKKISKNIRIEEQPTIRPPSMRPPECEVVNQESVYWCIY